jgi:cytochrome c oxidase assembly protein subunit 15
MGCPDWPTCFGSAIPPTSDDQVHFQPNHFYKKGQFIIYNDSLKYALQAFTSPAAYNATQWKQYEKHNNASFSVLHTWIEYLNRLLGALLGILILVQFGWSLAYRKQMPIVVLLSFLLILITAFQAWLGKTVVDSNLALVKTTLHLFGALVMVLLCEYILFIAKGKKQIVVPASIKKFTILLGVLMMFQLIMGTQVRAQIDVIAEQNHFINRSGWVALLNSWFYIHRSFSLIIGALALYIFIQSKPISEAASLSKSVIALILLEILIGVLLAYADFPQMGQPIHLLVSSLLVATIFRNILKLKMAS